MLIHEVKNLKITKNQKGFIITNQQIFIKILCDISSKNEKYFIRNLEDKDIDPLGSITEEDVPYDDTFLTSLKIDKISYSGFSTSEEKLYCKEQIISAKGNIVDQTEHDESTESEAEMINSRVTRSQSKQYMENSVTKKKKQESVSHKPKILCTKCDKIITQVNYWRNEPISCKLCSGKIQYWCDRCNMVFSKRLRASYHMKLLCKGQFFNFFCQNCGHKSHGVDSANIRVRSLDSGDVKVYQVCPICEKEVSLGRYIL